MNKKVYDYDDIKRDIHEAIETIAGPICSTMSPKGASVIVEDDNFRQFTTNDGVTIAKNIQLKDPVQNAIVQIIRHASLKTNYEAGDGTSTTVLLSRILIEEGLRLQEEGYNPMDIKQAYNNFAEEIQEELANMVIEVDEDDEEELYQVASISANNDEEIAGDVVEIIETAGLDGFIHLDDAGGDSTKIEKDTGFILEDGLFRNDLATQSGRFSAAYNNVPVLVTDKRLYYREEAETILQTVYESGFTDVVVVARDFIGQAPNFFIANHRSEENDLNVLLVKDSRATEDDNSTLEDLAIYLGTELVTESRGSLVDDITIDSFAVAESVYADAEKTVLSRDKEDINEDLSMRVAAIRSEIDDIEEDTDEKDKLKKRLAALTNGMVTVHVGGRTPMETNEKVYRYQDAIEATRATLEEGYLPGGGTAVANAFQRLDPHPNALFQRIFEKVGFANVEQIAKNCGEHIPSVLSQIDEEYEGYGYNAMTGEYGDMVEMGVIDPYKVVRMAIGNAVSVANVVIASKTLIVNDTDEEYETEHKHIN